MRCPRCDLLNPDTALRCDCGYDFREQTVKESYADRTFEPALEHPPKAFYVFSALIIIVDLGVVLAHRVAVWGLVFHLVLIVLVYRRKNWVRNLLGFSSFFYGGFYFMLSKKLKQYCSQKGRFLK